MYCVYFRYNFNLAESHVLLILTLILIPVVNATDRLNISAEVRSYSDIPDDEIYVGSQIKYNITFFNPNDYDIKRNFSISIIDEQEKIIHNFVKESFIIEPKKTKSLLPYNNGNETEYWLIYPLKSGSYRLEISSLGEPIEFYETKTIEIQLNPNEKIITNFYRHKTNSLEFPFAVASQYEKRLKNNSEEQFNKNIELNQKMLALNEEMLVLTKDMHDLTDTMTGLTWIMLFFSIIATLTTIHQIFKSKK